MEESSDQAAGALGVEGARGDAAGALGLEPEREDRREQDDAQRHQQHLEGPEGVGAVVEREPAGGADEDGQQEGGVAEEAEDDDRDRGAEGAAGIVRGGGAGVIGQGQRALQESGQDVGVGGRVEAHRDEQERGGDGERGGQDGARLAGRAGEGGGASAGGGGHGRQSPKSVPWTPPAGGFGAGSEWRWRGGRATRAASERARSCARRSTIPARQCRIHLGVKEDGV